MKKEKWRTFVLYGFTGNELMSLWTSAVEESSYNVPDEDKVTGSLPCGFT